MQESQHGTGHAVRVALEALGPRPVRHRGRDQRRHPAAEGASLRAFAEDHTGSGRAVSILTAEVRDPFGYGRMIRDADGTVAAIVEEKDATAEQPAVREINCGIFAFDAAFLEDVLPRLSNDNAKREFYLTDVVELGASGRSEGRRLPDPRRAGRPRASTTAPSWPSSAPSSTAGSWPAGCAEGVTVVDPATTWVDVDVVLAPDVTLLPGVQLLGATVVGEDAVVGPDCTLKDVEVGEGAKVVRTHGELAVVGAGATVGPFSYLRPGTRLGARGKIGAFVETKNAISAPAPRSRTCRTSATPRSARAPTSAPARSSPTTTASPSTARRSAGTCRPGCTTASSRP